MNNTFSMTPTERRLAKYARYRASEKGKLRTLRYNSSPAHQEACQRYRLAHWQEIKQRRADAREERERSFGNYLTSAQRLLLSWRMNPDLLSRPPDYDMPCEESEDVWNREHARFAKPFSSEHVREFWTKKYQRSEARELRAARRLTQARLTGA